ncbi:MAG: lipopolysaccharide heptosyltransferase II [Campylobacteraceae bacterium]|jgi:heptosyltransferase-1/heptosyltransferase-2|nr:lipopolysaccharide heptosyltransferase II [Campylobacteraceae bacterium]
MEYKNILIIKMSSLGDILHTLPFAAALRSRFKEAKITWLVHPQFSDFLPQKPIIDEVICFDKEGFKKLSLLNKIKYFFSMRKMLHSKKFDLVIDMQGLFKSAVLAAISGCKTRIGYCEMREFSGFISKAICGENKNAHVIERYLDVARFLGAKVDKIEFPMPNLDEAFESAQKKLGKIEKKYIIIAPAARWKTKEWLTEYFAKLCDMLIKDGLHVVLVGAKSDKQKSLDIINLITENVKNIIDLTGKTTLSELAALIKNCAFFISADTGPLHFAAAFKKPLIAMYGPTLSNRTGPYANEKASVIVTPSSCAGCLKKKCSNWHCMREITPEVVYEIFKEKIGQIND